MRALIIALSLLAIAPPSARAQESAVQTGTGEELDPSIREAAAWRAALERVNDRIRSSSISWLDGHLGITARLRMSPDGERAVTWAQDGSAWLWNAWTGEPIGLLGIFGMGETSFGALYSRDVRWPRLEFSADGERILLFEPLAGLAGLWDGRSAEFLGYLEVGREVARAAAFSPDGRRVVVASAAGLVRFFDADHGLALDAPVLRANDVAELSFSPDGSRVLALMTSGIARLWDTKSGALFGELGSEDLPFSSADFSADSTRVLAVSPDGVALIYPIPETTSTSIQPTVVRAPDGGWSAVDWGTGKSFAGIPDPMRSVVPVPPRGNRLIAIAADGSASLWDPVAARLVAPLDGVRLAPIGRSWAGFSPDGQRLVTLSPHGACLWDATSGSRIADLVNDRASDAADYATFGPGGRYFATASRITHEQYPTTRVYAARTGELVDELPSDGGSIYALHFSDGERLGSTSTFGWSTVWDGDRETVILRPHALQIAEEGIETGLRHWSPKGVHVISSTWDRQAWFADRLWDARTGSPVRPLPTGGFSGGGFVARGDILSLHSLGLTTITKVDPRGPAKKAGMLEGDRIVKLGESSRAKSEDLTAAIAGASSTTSVVVARAGKEVELTLDLALDSSPDVQWNSWVGLTQRLGVNGTLGVRAEIQDSITGQIRRAVELEDGPPGKFLHQVVVNRDATRLALRYGHRSVLYDLTSGKRLAEFTLDNSARWRYHDTYAHRVVMSAAGDVVAAAERDGVRVWTASDGLAPDVLPGYMSDLDISPDGRMLAGATIVGTVFVWDVAERILLRRLTGHRGEVRFVAFDPTGWRVVSAGSDGTARIWSLATEDEPLVLSGHAGLLNRPCFAPDGSRVITTGDDGTVHLWNAATGQEIAVLEGHVGPVIAGEFSPDGTRILTRAMDGSTRIWSGVDGRLFATRVEYDDGWVMFEPSGSFISGGAGAERAHMVVSGRRYPLSSYAAIYESPERVAASLAGKSARAPSFVPQAPEVRIAAPLDPLVPERVFRLEVLIEDAYGIESVHVVQDERELDAKWIGEHLAQSGKSARLSCELALPDGARQSTIKIRATNVRKIQSAPRTVFVRWEPPQRDLYVLALGVADYADDSLDLAYPTKDADDLIARFTREQGGYYKKVNTQRLVNGEVTPGKLLKAREEFLLRAQPEDTIVVFAAGHGVRSASGEYYFLTPASTPDNPYDGVERQVLESLVTWDRLHAKRRILLLDTCHSGEAFGEGKRGVSAGAFDQKTVNEAAGSGLYIIAASSDRGFAQEMSGNGLFTSCLIDGLDGAADTNKDGFVGIDELKTYATVAVHEKSGGRQRPTAPKIEGGEDFPLARVH